METVGLVVAGLAGLVIGGEMLVRGAVSAAKGFGISPMIIGLTLVGFGTSMPELVTSLQAALSGSPGIALGNVLGSNIGNILLILGIAVLLAPIAVDPKALRRDGGMLILATLLCLGVVLFGGVSRLEGAVLVTTLAAYLTFTLRSEQGRALVAASEAARPEESVSAPEIRLGLALSLSLAGLVVTILGAKALVSGAVDIAEAAGISETVIGLTVVAVGTSLPELVTCIIAVRKGQGEMALGNVLGSNIFNILCILGVTALVSPLPVAPEIIRADIWVMTAAAVLLVIFARTGWRVGRREGAVMLGGYAGYMGWLLT